MKDVYTVATSNVFAELDDSGVSSNEATDDVSGVVAGVAGGDDTVKESPHLSRKVLPNAERGGPSPQTQPIVEPSSANLQVIRPPLRGGRGGRGRREGDNELSARGGVVGGGYRGRGGGFRARGPPAGVVGADGRLNEPVHGGGSDEEYGQRSPRDRPSSRGNGRGAGQTRHRDFDRHVSGTNRSRGMKKGGAGAHNWGAQDDYIGDLPRVAQVGSPVARVCGEAEDFSNSMEKTGDKNKDAEVEDIEERKPEATAEEDGTLSKPVVEPEPIGFEEFRRMQAAKRMNLPTLPSVKLAAATQRSDLEKEGYMLHVKENDNKRSAANASTTANVDYYIQKAGGANDLDLFNDPGSRPRSGGRGGRGGSAAVRGRGRDDKIIEGAPITPSILRRDLNLKDAEAFPTLG